MAIYRRTQDYLSRTKPLLILSIVVLVAGILILSRPFMTWTAGQTGWSLKVLQPGRQIVLRQPVLQLRRRCISLIQRAVLAHTRA